MKAKLADEHRTAPSGPRIVLHFHPGLRRRCRLRPGLIETALQAAFLGKSSRDLECRPLTSKADNLRIRPDVALGQRRLPRLQFRTIVPESLKFLTRQGNYSRLRTLPLTAERPFSARRFFGNGPICYPLKFASRSAMSRTSERPNAVLTKP